MILTGNKIKEEIKSGKITIKPFTLDQVNPNSYNYRLGSILRVFEKFDGSKSLFKQIKIPQKGYILEPRKMYLAKYAMSLIGKSSMGRYGLFLQCSANLGHTTSKHKWTLEIVAAIPIKLYPGMIIGQVSFWRNFGSVKEYKGQYGFLNHPQESFVPLNERENYDTNGK